MKENYTPGEGCECSARCSCECGCDVDWTPREVYELREQRDRLAEALDMLDEVIKKMRPRYMGHPTMDGRFPCWTVWMPHTGTTERKSLKEAVLEYLAAVEGGSDE